MAREAAKLAQARMKLAALEPGGGPDRPIEVSSASLVEPHASSQPCPACGNGGGRVDEHIAIDWRPHDGAEARRLRVAKMVCARCGVRRDVYFRIGTVMPS